MKASHLVDIHVKGDEVQLLSTLTLVYRAIPAPEGSVSRFCDECVDSARRAVVKHQACMQLVSQEAYVKTIYLHWYVEKAISLYRACFRKLIVDFAQEPATNSFCSLLCPVLLCHRDVVARRSSAPPRLLHNSRIVIRLIRNGRKAMEVMPCHVRRSQVVC